MPLHVYIHFLEYITNLSCGLSTMYRPLPSAFGKRVRGGKSKAPVPPSKRCRFERDIVCLPKTKEGSIPIPRSKAYRSLLASNGLMGKIVLDSSMTEEEIMREIRSVFRKPMGFNTNFCFKVLQPAGGGSKTLTVPSLSPSYQWTASAVAGKNAKSPIYIMAVDDLQV